MADAQVSGLVGRRLRFWVKGDKAVQLNEIQERRPLRPVRVRVLVFLCHE